MSTLLNDAGGSGVRSFRAVSTTGEERSVASTSIQEEGGLLRTEDTDADAEEEDEAPEDEADEEDDSDNEDEEDDKPAESTGWLVGE